MVRKCGHTHDRTFERLEIGTDPVNVSWRMNVIHASLGEIFAQNSKWITYLKKKLQPLHWSSHLVSCGFCHLFSNYLPSRSNSSKCIEVFTILYHFHCHSCLAMYLIRCANAIWSAWHHRIWRAMHFICTSCTDLVV